MNPNLDNWRRRIIVKNDPETKYIYENELIKQSVGQSVIPLVR